MADEAQIQAPRHSEAGKHRHQEQWHWALSVLGIGAILGLCYWADMVLAVMMTSVLIAFILAPVVDLFMHLRLPRGVAAAIAVTLLFVLIGGIFYLSYNQASSFVGDLPKYTAQIREQISKFLKKAEDFDVLGESPDKGTLNVHSTSTLTEILTRGFGSVSAILLASSFVPFLVYFMLTWQQHVRSATVMLFPLESRHTAYVTLGLISQMVRSF